ncbi:MAG TPA: hypothetical protein VFC18_07020, partial [Burkholderiales bacterium]|nr:hypothetical protein [Burkholderiales bacterium]
MKRALLLLLVVVATTSGAALAHRGGHGGGGHGGGRVHLGFHFGFPAYYPYWYGPSPYYYYPPPVVVTTPAAPPVYIERERDADFWYFCEQERGYYPYVKQCPGGWTVGHRSPPTTTYATHEHNSGQGPFIPRRELGRKVLRRSNPRARGGGLREGPRRAVPRSASRRRS